MLVVQPQSADEVQAVVRICAAVGIPLVAQGGNTGLTGAGLPSADRSEVLLSLRRMNRIRGIDLDSDTMVVEAGCILEDVRNAARAAGRLFPLLLGAQGSCTIGGNIATNAGGINALRYGPMRDLVMGLEVVLADSRLWDGLKSLQGQCRLRPEAPVHRLRGNPGYRDSGGTEAFDAAALIRDGACGP